MEERGCDLEASTTKRRRRKWAAGSKYVRSFWQLQECISLFGGVYHVGIDRFMNTPWIMSQQYKYLMDSMSQGRLVYPVRTFNA